MNKKTIIAFLAITVIALNLYISLEHDSSLIKFIHEDERLTEEERAWLESHGSITYCSDYNSPPLRYVENENSQYQGVIVDYMNALSINIETKIKFEPKPTWEDAYESVKTGESDCIDMIKSPVRSLSFNFSKPIYRLRGTAAFLEREENISDISDLTNKKIAVQKSDYAIEFLRVNAVSANIVQTENMSEALLKLRKGEVDLVVGDEPVIKFISSKLGMENKIALMSKPLYEEDVVLAVAKSKKELLSVLNKSIAELEKRNTIQKIQEKWFGAYSVTESDTSKKARFILISFAAMTIVLSYVFYSWNGQLKKEVEKRTAQLKSNKNDLIATFDGFTDYLVVVDRHGNVVLANQSICEKIGKQRKAVIGRNYEESIDFPCWKYAKLIIRKTFASGISMSEEYKCRKNIFSVNTFPIRESGDETQRVLAVIKDVTSVKVSERMLLHEDKMVAVGQLAGGVAHEIRNPLGIIKNYAFLIKKNASNTQEVIESAKSIEQSVDRASGIIENLLNFSRLSPNRLIRTNMKTFIESIFMLHSKLLEKKSIDYSILCADEVECNVNQESLKHILINLVSNSIDAIDECGEIEAECKVVDDGMMIRISDSGCGMNEEEVENIFTPFYTTKEPGKGTGLGLYVVYNEAKKIGGEVRVYSSKGQGTTFEVVFQVDE